jgi:hypothetical protein
MAKNLPSYEEWKKTFDESFDPSFGDTELSERDFKGMYWREVGQFRKIKKGQGSY